jgi:3-hydroxy acid dehydrogenase / malonic semialdehyde reductase
MAGLKGKIVLITGASSGIGEACAEAFAKAGAHLVLSARRAERLDEKAARLDKRFGARCLVVPLDVRDRKAVGKAFATLPKRWAAVDVLINNAGLGRGMDKLHEGHPEEWDEMLDTNVKGLLHLTRAVVPGMVERGRGHVINIGSLAGREVYPGGNVYCASKFAVKALTRGLKQDLSGTPVRVSTVDPGMVETEFSVVRFRGDEARAAKVYEGLKALTAEDIAEAVLWVASRPAHVDVTEMVILPTAQSSATLAHRKT